MFTIPGHRVLGELGRGGMGIVYRARQESPRREVALKMLLPHSIKSAELRQRFMREAATLSRLDHPSILPVYTSGEHDGFPWFTMKLAKGGALAERIRAYAGRWEAVAELVAQLAAAVQHAHEHGVLHRDLKPGNVLFDEPGQVYVADFGLAKLADTDTDLTRSQGLLGTPHYLAPEIVRADARAATTASDIYGLGAILCELLTGTPPYQAGSAGELLEAIAEGRPLLAGEEDKRIPRDLRVICLKCLARLPTDRYWTAREVAEELERFQRREPIQARPLSAWESLARWVKRKPALAAATGLSGLLLVGISVTSTLAAHRINGLRLEALRKLYAADMHRAFKDVAENKWGAAQELLDLHRPQAGEPDLRGFEWRHLEQLCRGNETATLGTNLGFSQRVTFSPDGQYAASAGKELLVWRLPAGRVAGRLRLPDVVSSLRFSPDSRQIAVATRDGVVQMAAVPPGLAANSAVGPAVAPFLQSVASATNQGGAIQALLWQGAVGQLELFGGGGRFDWDGSASHQLKERPLGRMLGRVAVSADGGTVASLPETHELCVWRGASSTNPEVIRLVTGSLGLAVSPDGGTVVTGDSEGKLCVRDLVSKAPPREVAAHRGMVECIAFSPGGGWLASAGLDSVIRIFDTGSWQVVRTLHGHHKNVMAVEFSPDENWLISGAMDQTVKLWNLAQNAPEPGGSEEDLGWCVLSDDGSHVAYTGSNGFFGKFLAVGSNGMAAVPCRMPFRGSPRSFCDSPKGTVVLLSTGEMQFATPAGQLQSRQFPPMSEPKALSPDGNLLLYATLATNALGVWDFTTASTRFQIPTMGSVVAYPIFSGDSRRIGVGFKLGEARVYDVASGRKLATLKCGGWPYSVGFSADGRRLVTAGFERWVRLWDVESGRLLARYQSDVEIFWSVALSPDGRRIAAGTPESSIVVWEVETQEQVASWTLGGALGPVEGALRFTADGNTLANCNATRLRTWRASPP